MGELVTPRFEINAESSVFTTVRNLADVIAPIDDELRQLDEWRAEVRGRRSAAILEAVKALGGPAIGDMVTATVIKVDRDNPAICIYDQATWGRTYWGQNESLHYAPRNQLLYRKEATGRLVGVDPWAKALVLNPKMPLVRIWVHLFDQNGENAVDLKLAPSAQKRS